MLAASLAPVIHKKSKRRIREWKKFLKKKKKKRKILGKKSEKSSRWSFQKLLLFFEILGKKKKKKRKILGKKKRNSS